MANEKILLGAHTYVVRPQRIGYLIHKLGPNLQEALTAEIEGVDGAALLGAKAHEVLKVFIPDLMPLHEFIGFGSEEAMRTGAYDEDADSSPEPLQVKAAFKAASDVNGGQVLSRLKALVGPAMIQKLSALVLAKMAESAETSTSPISAPSPTSPSTNGGSGSTSSSPTPQTTTPAASAA